MRIALLGPAGDRPWRLSSAAAFCVCEQQCDVLFYLGNEENVIADFAERRERLADPTAGSELWQRTLGAANASADELTQLVSELRAQEAWTQLVFLGKNGPRRLTLPNGREWVLCHDRRQLPDYVGAQAAVVAYGNSEHCVIDHIVVARIVDRVGMDSVDVDSAGEQNAGEQILLSPGRGKDGGVAIVDDTTAFRVTVYDANLDPIVERHLERPVAVSALEP